MRATKTVTYMLHVHGILRVFLKHHRGLGVVKQQLVQLLGPDDAVHRLLRRAASSAERLTAFMKAHTHGVAGETDQPKPGTNDGSTSPATRPRQKGKHQESRVSAPLPPSNHH